LSKLLQVLTDLATNPNKNPSDLMDEANLSRAERDVIMSREAAKIAALFHDELAPSAIGFVDPSPDPEPEPEPDPYDEPDDSFR
jgi:hypothetical protein